MHGTVAVDLEQGPRIARLPALVRGRARIDEPAAIRQPLDQGDVAVAEQHSVHLVGNEGAGGALWRGLPDAEVAMDEAEPDSRHLDDSPPTEPSRELGAIVVARHRIEGCDRLEQRRHVRPGEVAEMEDQLHALVTEAVHERSGEGAPEPGQVRVRDEPDPQPAT